MNNFLLKSDKVTLTISNSAKTFRDIYVYPEQTLFMNMRIGAGLNLPALSWHVYDDPEMLHWIAAANPEYLYPLDIEKIRGDEIRIPTEIEE